jgi:hypothetical protein
MSEAGVLRTQGEKKSAMMTQAKVRLSDYSI